MPTLAKVGQFIVGSGITAGTSIPISDVGFEPKLVIFFNNASNSVETQFQSFTLGMGAATSSGNRISVSTSAEHLTNRWGSWLTSNTSIANFYASSGGNYSPNSILDFGFIATSGFEVVVDDQFSENRLVSYLALGGSDITNVKTDFFMLPTSSGIVTVSGVGFRPDALILLSTLTKLNQASANEIKFSAGVIDTSGNTGTVGIGSDSQQLYKTPHTHIASGEVINIYNYFSNPVNVETQYFLGYTDDGFILDKRGSNDSTAGECYIAIKGGSYKVGNFYTQNNTNDIVINTGFRPAAVLFLSGNQPENTSFSDYTHGAHVSIGAATSPSNRGANSMWAKYGEYSQELPTTAVSTYNDAIYISISGETVKGLMDFKSTQDTGFTTVMDMTESGSFIFYLAMGYEVSTLPISKISRATVIMI